MGILFWIISAIIMLYLAILVRAITSINKHEEIFDSLESLKHHETT